ncbi:MAG: non-hydrolyzing UDP-N-acetylglucosamine 2-epimerase [Promethearchaeota archaeon]
MYTIAFILGTRPEIIKTWSIIRHADQDPDIRSILIHTGQHYDYEMSQIFFEDLKIREPDVFLEAQGETHGSQTASMLVKIEDFLLKEEIDVVGVLGDTNSAMAGALAARKINIPSAHFEAGCRSFDRKMPEELNRLIIDAISSILFAPSAQAEINLLWEGKPSNRIFMCGNTQKDVINHVIQVKRDNQSVPKFESPYGVLTIHRPENTDDLERLRDIITGIKNSPIPIVFPVHPRTKKQIQLFDLSNDFHPKSKIRMIPPLGYLSFINLLKKAHLVLTDSGGVQEEAAILNIPCITLRETSEWPETIISGKNLLVGHNSDLILNVINKLHHDIHFVKKMSKPVNLFEADAGKRIISVLKNLKAKEELRYDSINMSKTGYPIPFLASKITDLNEQEALFRTLRFKEDGNVMNSDLKFTFELQLVKRFNKFNPITVLNKN